MQIGINRIIAPSLPLFDFFSLAQRCGCSIIELRNDLKNQHPFEGKNPEEVRDLLAKHRLKVAAINALQRFNEYTEAKKEELRSLLDYAKSIRADAIVLCPVNGIERNADRAAWLERTTQALFQYGPLFEEYGLYGYVEPLGFRASSLRTKAEALKAIEASGYERWYRLVHDTFHHHLADEQEYFASMTGLVHLSSVAAGLRHTEPTDADRTLFLEDDLLATREQAQTLVNSGYRGIFSFEPFSPAVQHLDIESVETELKKSITLLFR
ncbi:MAG: TIM barrel protein [Spirochaetales bacterium]|nr:TIM barrel protein [Spirochaetales bacterium]